MFARDRRRPAKKGEAVNLSDVPKSAFSFGPRGKFTTHHFSCVVPRNDPNFDICVTDDLRPKAVALFRGLVAALEEAGVATTTRKIGEYDVRTVMTGPRSQVEFALREQMRMQRLLPDPNERLQQRKVVWVPCGQLRAIVMGHGHAHAMIDDVAKLGALKAQVEAVREAVFTGLQRVVEFEEVAERRRQAERAERERRELEARKRSDLITAAEHWRRGRVVHEFLDAYEKQERENGGPTEELNAWFSWARGVADEPPSTDAQARTTAALLPCASSGFWAGYWARRR